VLAGGGTPPEYGELLLQVGHRRTQFALAAPALGEPVSFLERRIHRMATTLPRWRWAGAATAAVVAAGAIAGACEAPRPVSPDPATITKLEARTDSATPALRARLDSVFAAARRVDSGIVRRRTLDLASRQAAAAVRQHFPELLQGREEPVYVWVVLAPDGRVLVKGTAARAFGSKMISTEMGARLIPGYDTLLARRARDHGALRYGVIGYGVLAPNSPPVMWVSLGDDRERDLSTFDQHPEVLVLPWIRDGITRYYPALLQERSGPRIELWFVADAQKRVVRTVQRPGPEGIGVGIEEIHAVFPDLDESNVWGWRVAQGRGLGKLVRDNVRVVWIQLREGKIISGMVPAATRDVQEPRPTLSWSPAPVYPALLRSAGIRGRVIVQAIIDETGRADTASVTIVESPHPGFNQAAKEWILAARFDPARVQGRAVRAPVNVPVEFAIE
jgi:TonB family protein